MTIVRSITCIAFLLLLPLVSLAAGKPNIVFIIVDDMGLYNVGAYGSVAVQTPNIDRLAREGMRFTQAYSGCSVCAPARSTLMTGYHMGHTPVRANPGGVSLADSDVTVAEVLGKAGYISAGFGKWGLGDLDTPGVPEKQGFVRFVGYYHQVHAHYYFPDYMIDTGHKIPLPGNHGFYDREPGEGAFPLSDAATGRQRTFTHYPVMEAMKQFIQANKDRPFFCYAPWTPPHGRYEIPGNDPAWLQYKDKPWDKDTKAYAAFCSMIDRGVGETLQLLKELDIDNNTIVFFVSDNGGVSTGADVLKSQGDLRGEKGSLYEGGIRIPFIARWPGEIKPGSTSDLPVYFPDFLPTAAELAGATAQAPGDIDGISLVPELTGQKKLDRERTMYWEWNGAHFEIPYLPKRQATRRGKWKIVRHELDGAWELYNLSRDPSEKTNLASRHPEIVSELSAWVEANREDNRPQVEPEGANGKRFR